jgi:hypothetical protein
MTGPECVALRELQAAEMAAEQAVLALEIARERYWAITRRETRRERVKGRANAYLRLVSSAAEE